MEMDEVVEVKSPWKRWEPGRFAKSCMVGVEVIFFNKQKGGGGGLCHRRGGAERKGEIILVHK